MSRAETVRESSILPTATGTDPMGMRKRKIFAGFFYSMILAVLLVLRMHGQGTVTRRARVRVS